MMALLSRSFILVALIAVRVWAPPVAAVASATPGCAPRVAVLGADIAAGGRFEVQRALAVGPHTVQLQETVADERAQAHGLIPANLLFNVAISSAVLRPLPPGSGLTVTLNPAITLDTAQTYANALLTAGVTDAAVGVAAPAAQPALGTTALLGLLRAAQAACHPISLARQELAIREVVLTSQLAGALGRQVAPRLLFALKSAAAARRLNAPARLSALIAHDSAALGVGVPAALRPRLSAFLHDLVTSGAYAAIAAAHPSISGLTLLHATVRLGSSGGAPAASRSGASTAPRAEVWRGTVVAASDAAVTLRLSRGQRVFQPAPGLRVDRDGRRGGLGVLRAGDTIAISTNAAGVVTAARVTTQVAAPGRGGNAVFTLLALLVLLALIIVPALVSVSRRRPAPAPAMAMPAWRSQPSDPLRSLLLTARARGRSVARRGKGRP